MGNICKCHKKEYPLCLWSFWKNRIIEHIKVTSTFLPIDMGIYSPKEFLFPQGSPKNKHLVVGEVNSILFDFLGKVNSIFPVD